MRLLFYFFLLFTVIKIRGQVGINTKLPEATLDIVGKPTDANHFDGVIPPRITGDQLAAKIYTLLKKGTIVFVTTPPTDLVGQVKYVIEAGLHCFDGNFWQSLSQDDPIEYHILLTFDSNSTTSLAATSTWSRPTNQWGNTNGFLTSSKSYKVGTKNWGGLSGNISFRKVNGIVNIRFQVFRSYLSAPITENAFINIGDICSDLGFVPYQIVLLHQENSTQYFPALLENFNIQIPQSSLNVMSSSYYTYGEVQVYSNWRKPYLN